MNNIILGQQIRFARYHPFNIGGIVIINRKRNLFLILLNRVNLVKMVAFSIFGIGIFCKHIQHQLFVNFWSIFG